MAYVSALKETVMRPLQGIRDRQTKIKLRIKDDLKTAEAVRSPILCHGTSCQWLFARRRDTGRAPSTLFQSSRRRISRNVRSWKSKNVRTKLSRFKPSSSPNLCTPVNRIRHSKRLQSKMVTIPILPLPHLRRPCHPARIPRWSTSMSLATQRPTRRLASDPLPSDKIKPKRC